MHTLPPQLHPIAASDWPIIGEIQQQCYPGDMNEELAILQNKQNHAPDCCFVMKHQGKIMGYCLAHPWHLEQPPLLHQLLPEITAPKILYIHDVAVFTSGRGLGLARIATDYLKTLATAKGYNSLNLVAVEGADSYWQRLGFHPQTTTKDLSIYGENAQYMTLSILD